MQDALTPLNLEDFILASSNFKPMHWFNSQLKSSLLALLGSDVLTPFVREDRTEDIREWMLDELEQSEELKFPQIVRQVRYATDAQALWFIRGEVMTALAAMHGETVAREKINHISQKFKGLLPKGLNSRLSSLNR